MTQEYPPSQYSQVTPAGQLSHSLGLGIVGDEVGAGTPVATGTLVLATGTAVATGVLVLVAGSAVGEAVADPFGRLVGDAVPDIAVGVSVSGIGVPEEEFVFGSAVGTTVGEEDITGTCVIAPGFGSGVDTTGTAVGTTVGERDTIGSGVIGTIVGTVVGTAVLVPRGELVVGTGVVIPSKGLEVVGTGVVIPIGESVSGTGVDTNPDLGESVGMDVKIEGLVI